MTVEAFDRSAVFNQSPDFETLNFYLGDRMLRDAVRREGGGDERDLAAFGAVCGSAEALELGRLANSHPPCLKRYDAKGRRIDRVEFHPAYHELMAISFAQGLHSSPWAEDAGEGAHVHRCAGSFMAIQMEAGHCCPITMTNASLATLRLDPALADEWRPKILSRIYDPEFRPVGEKRSATIGMGMTEKQGGTDVRANITRAEPLGDGAYRIDGHKWFMSAPMSDAFLILAQAPGGLSCFFLPRFLPDGSVNGLRFERLKDKLGNRSNASAEVEFHGATGWLVGEEGRGVPAIIEMVTLTRLDCAVGSAGLMRLGLSVAIHHAAHRTVFQRKLVDQPLMCAVLADMAIEMDAAIALVFRLARAFDRAQGDEQEAAYRRLMTPVAKYWVCKTAPAFLCEAMECLGGNGYVEEGLLARAYREAPVNAIWEGSGNVIALDVLRVAERAPEAVESVMSQFRRIAGANRPLQAAIDDTLALIRGGEQRHARIIAERIACLAAACHLLEAGLEEVAHAHVRTKFGAAAGQRYGAGEHGLDPLPLIERAALHAL